MRVAAHTLGCKLNFAETSQLLRRFAQAGHTVVDFHEEADLYIVNTCTVTAVAERKCRTAIRQAVRQNPKAQVAVVGCFAQNGRQQIEKIEGVTWILGNDEKHRLLEIVERAEKAESELSAEPIKDGRWEFAGAWSSGDRTRAFLKIQDGCDYFCTYCAIPQARGRSRSATIEEVVKMAEECAKSGAKEIVLTGVNTGTFGQQRGESFIELLRKLDDIESIARYRISSIEPNLITDEIIEFTARSRAFLPHFHIPLQAGSDNVLRLMHRHYDTALYREKVEKIKSEMPDACIAADIIAGCNGETEDDFGEAKAFLNTLPLSYLHVFTYSERPNTMALKITPKTDMHQRRKRSQELHELSEKKMRAFVESQVGKEREVLWESSRHDGEMYGLTDNYIRVRREYDPELSNTVTEVVLSKENIVVGAPTD